MGLRWCSSRTSRSVSSPNTAIDLLAMVHAVDNNVIVSITSTLVEFNSSFPQLTANEVGLQCCMYIAATVVVFDGYGSGPSSKDETHQRRSWSNMKKAFLTNPRNKQKVLYFIASELEKAGVELYHSAGDADYGIMSTACTMSKRRSVAVVGDDTDLLDLLLHHISVPDIMSCSYSQQDPQYLVMLNDAVRLGDRGWLYVGR